MNNAATTVGASLLIHILFIEILVKKINKATAAITTNGLLYANKTSKDHFVNAKIQMAEIARIEQAVR